MRRADWKALIAPGRAIAYARTLFRQLISMQIEDFKDLTHAEREVDRKLPQWADDNHE